MQWNRIEWIDSVRGLGIVLVILGHMAIPELARQFIFSFHMPLFFFISGFLYRDNFSANWCLRKLDSLFLPYVIYGLISIGVFSIEGKVPTSYMCGSFFKGNGVGVLWFLICLLMAELIGGCVMRLCRSTCALGALILLSALLGWLVPLAVEHNVLMIRTVPAALFFWLTGCASRRYFAGRNMEGRGFPFILLTALIVGALFVVQRVDMAGARYGNIILFYLTALAWVGMIILAFARIGWCPRSLTWLGRHSLPLMCLHELIPVSLGVALPIIFDGIDIPKFLFRVVNMALLIGLTAIIGRCLPVLAGKGKIFQWKVA